MKEKHALRNYLIRLFLLILALTGLTESILNLLYHNLVSPWLTELTGGNPIFAGSSLTSILAAFADSFFWLFLGMLASLLPGSTGTFLQITASEHAREQILGKFLSNTGDMASAESYIYTLGIFCIFLLLFLVWLFPYLVASASFAFLVSKKAAMLEHEKAEQQKAYERQRNLLLSDVAHDLKTPLTTIAGYASALTEETKLAPELQQEYLNAIYRKSMQVNELVQLLFEYVRLDSEGFSLKKENSDFAELVRGCIADFYNDFEEKEMELEWNIPEEAIPLSLDHIQFERAIHNLFMNALKHNPVGTKVSVCVKLSTTDIVLSVSDNGVLIPDEIIANLFEPFVQGDASRNSKNGSGLGLSITKKIIEMHGGTLTLVQAPSDSFLPEGYSKSFVITLQRNTGAY